MATGDGIRRYPNGANQNPPYRGLLHLEEVSDLDDAYYRLHALKNALPSAAARRDAATAERAIARLFERDRATPR